MKPTKNLQAVVLVLFLSLPLAAYAISPRSEHAYPLGTWNFGASIADVKETDSQSTPLFEKNKLVTFEIIEYAGSDYSVFKTKLKDVVERMRRDFVGATFGINAETKAPVEFSGALEVALLEMLSRSPALAEDIRGKGGVMTSIFEIRPTQQPSNVNLYVHAIYSAKDRAYQLKMLLDSPDRVLRDDITGMVVDMPGDGAAP